jgi:hypothetical protein
VHEQSREQCLEVQNTGAAGVGLRSKRSDTSKLDLMIHIENIPSDGVELDLEANSS